MSFHLHLVQAVVANDHFRKVLFTGQKSQLVAMSIPVGGEVGEETHAHVEQTLYFHSGRGQAMLNDEVFEVQAGDFVIVTPGTRHNFKNIGQEPLKISTVYAPANHIDGRVHATKADADADEEDEAFGEAQV